MPTNYLRRLRRKGPLLTDRERLLNQESSNWHPRPKEAERPLESQRPEGRKPRLGPKGSER